MSLDLSKSALRREMRARLKAAVTVETRAEKSLAVCHAITRHPSYLQARTVATFDAMPAEPEVGLLWELAPRRFVYPRIHGADLLLIEVPARDALQPHEAGKKHREPAHAPERIVEPAAIDLILVPGLAFTRGGFRLGRGGGYYDRLLAQLPPRIAKLGVCFHEQLIENLPTEPHDIQVDAVLTDA